MLIGRRCPLFPNPLHQIQRFPEMVNELLCVVSIKINPNGEWWHPRNNDFHSHRTRAGCRWFCAQHLIGRVKSFDKHSSFYLLPPTVNHLYPFFPFFFFPLPHGMFHRPLFAVNDIERSRKIFTAPSALPYPPLAWQHHRPAWHIFFTGHFNNPAGNNRAGVIQPSAPAGRVHHLGASPKMQRLTYSAIVIPNRFDSFTTWACS